MKIIVDSGSTKMDWVIMNYDNIIRTVTGGFNPYYHSAEILSKYAEQISMQVAAEEVDAIYFYGSGCSSERNYKIVASALGKHFPNAVCCVYHDLLAAARALFGKESGIACILGTGSNSCLYDGNQVIENVPSIGWMFGDEGSGTYIGKLIIYDFLRDLMPSDAKELFISEYKLSFEEILKEIYAKGDPNSFFAKFPPFVLKNIKNKYFNKLVMKNLDDFYYWQISRYSNFKEERIAFVGSIAFYFEKQIEEWAKANGLNVSKIIKYPIDGLIKYHSI